MNHDQATAADAMWDALLRFETFDTYVTQSANTRDGKRAEPAQRAPLSRELLPA